jgi:ArsR family transcriptional regulator, zinc-responsive transcriptional repressor
MNKIKPHQINEQTVQRVSQIFKALGDPTRIRILNLICCEEMSVNDMAEQLGMNQSAVSHQLRLLKTLEIVKFRREGTTLFYSVADDHILHLLHQAIEHAGHE